MYFISAYVYRQEAQEPFLLRVCNIKKISHSRTSNSLRRHHPTIPYLEVNSWKPSNHAAYRRCYICRCYNLC